MVPGLDDPSRDDRDAGAQSEQDFACQRARKRELLDLQRLSWAQGRPVDCDELLSRWPGNPKVDPDTASLLLEDYLQRRRRGEEVSRLDYERRFPQQQRSLERAIEQETMWRSVGRESDRSGFSLRLPEVGDQVFGFRLCQPLGQGAFARVFLAQQADLASRFVVLKISNIEGDEPQTLAQLLHTSIVPIYSLHDDRRAGLRAVCMPYLGGASLSAVLTKLWTHQARPVSGKQLMQALEAVETPKPASAVQSRQSRRRSRIQT